MTRAFLLSTTALVTTMRRFSPARYSRDEPIGGDGEQIAIDDDPWLAAGVPWARRPADG